MKVSSLPFKKLAALVQTIQTELKPKLKYEVSIADVVNALENLESLVMEYFNLDEGKDEEDEGIDPENRHLGEPGMAPASSNEGITVEAGKSSALVAILEAILAIMKPKDLQSDMQNPEDLQDERILDPESVKDSDLIEHDDKLPPGPIGCSMDADGILATDRQVAEPDPLNPEASEEDEDRGSPVNSSGEAYLSVPKDVEEDDENGTKEKETSSAATDTTAEVSGNQAKESQDEKEKVEIGDEEEEEGGPGAVDDTPNQVGWFDSKPKAKAFNFSNLGPVIASKGLDHYKASEDGLIHSKGSMAFSNFGKQSMEDYYPTDEELGDINANHSLVNMGKSDLIVIPITAADTDIDRGGEHFTKDGLESFVPLYRGKALLLDHSWTTGSEVGKIFDASVVGNQLKVKAYIPNIEENSKLIKNILAGVHSRASVGFSMDVRNVTCDSCAYSMAMKKGPPTLPPTEGTISYAEGISIFDEENCPHRPGALDEYGNKTTVTLHKVADVMELSFVPVPMQPKAGTSRTLSAIKSTENIMKTIQTANDKFIKSVEEISNIISNSTKGELTVSDLTAPREGGSGAGEAMSPDAAKPFDVVGNEHRATNDNIFASAAVKNLSEISDTLKTLTKDLMDSYETNKQILEELKELQKAKPKKDEDDEDAEAETDKSKTAIDELTKAITEVISTLATKSEEKPEETKVSWAQNLISDFNKSLKG